MMGALHQPTRARENLAWGFACQVVCQVWIGLRGNLLWSIPGISIDQPLEPIPESFSQTGCAGTSGKARNRYTLGTITIDHDDVARETLALGDPCASPAPARRSSEAWLRSDQRWTCQRANIQQPSEVSHFLWPIGNQPCKQFVLAKSTVWM